MCIRDRGSGTFNNLFTVISYLSCSDGEVEDEFLMDFEFELFEEDLPENQ